MKTQIGLAWLLATMLTGCGGSSSDAPSSNVATGSYSVAISDSPMHGITAVGLQLNYLVMTDADGVEHRYDLEHMMFNLLDYQANSSMMVVENLRLPVGSYHNVYLEVQQGDGNNGCYVEDGLGRHGLQLQDGTLPLMDFSVSADQQYSFTLEVGVMMGLQQGASANYQLNHNGSWAINNQQMGHLWGEVDPQWIADCEVANADKAVDGSFMHLAYLYPNSVTGIGQMGDMGHAGNGVTAPIAVAPMHQDSAGNWYFGMGFLPENEYRIGYSCLGQLDEATTDELTGGAFTMFADAGSVTITPGSTGGTETVHVCGMGNGGFHGGGMGHHGG